METVDITCYGLPKFQHNCPSSLSMLTIKSDDDDTYTVTATDTVDGSAMSRTFTQVRYATEWVTNNFQIKDIYFEASMKPSNRLLELSFALTQLDSRSTQSWASDN